MSHAAHDHSGSDDKTTMRRLGLAVAAMCCGVIGLIVLAVSIGY